MSRQKKAGTISALLIGLLVLGVCLANMGTRVSAIARLQNATVTPTPCDDDEDVCSEYATEDAIVALTATAGEKTALAEITPSAITATATSATSATSTTTPGVGTPTVRPALTSTSFPTAAPLAPSPIQPTPIIEPQRIEPTETPTVIPDSALICFPGRPLVITGDGPPRAAFLLYFGQRAVSGGSVAPNGRFATTLIVGRERAGVYTISVRIRGTAQVLLETSCVVPNVTPTLIPRARELP
ncbi:MAG: hypothetical protein M3R61_03535 [Chloroflexota bacterium]|nr:hypothetical protein [Chloroflexota bacterium]